MGQEHKEYTWHLIAKKLTGEASPEELLELEALLRGNPELHYPMQTISDLWKSSSPEDKRMAERAFSRHLDRMKELNTDFLQTGLMTPSGTKDPADTIANPSLTNTPTANDRNAVAQAAAPNADGKAAVVNAATQAGARDTTTWTPTYTPWPTDQETIEKPGLFSGSRKQKKILWATSILFLIIAGITVYTRSGHNSPAIAKTLAITRESRSEITTRNGSRTNMLLPDGTQVWLNAGSRITYDKNYGTTTREVNLTGEAFFDVAHNSGKPFVIHTARVDIKVLGTRFNVKSYPTDKTTETTLIRGSIEVSIKDRPTEKIILKPNEKLVVANDDSTLHRKIPDHPDHVIASDESLVSIRKPTYESTTGAVIETSWVDNKLIFQDERFGDLARQMERWYGVVIRFSNSKEEELRFTGIFANETIQQALEALKLTGASPFNYTMNENIITIHDK